MFRTTANITDKHATGAEPQLSAKTLQRLLFSIRKVSRYHKDTNT